MTITYKAAWVPDDDPERPWEEAAQWAIDWIEKRCAEEQATAVLITYDQHGRTANPTLNRFASRHLSTTLRIGRRGLPSGTGPVLAYVPNEGCLDLAMSLARESSLAVVEGSLYPLRGWAMETKAINLANPEAAPLEVDSALAKEIEHLAFCGHNGYGPGFDRNRARSILRDLRAQGLLDAEVIRGAVAARGVSPRGVKKLEELINELS